jgi:F5/8 type C domain
MIQRPINPRSWPAAVSFVVTAVALSLVGTFLALSAPAAGMQQSRNGDEPVSGTPVAATAEVHDPLDSDPSQGVPTAGDPLDGDPLDGPPAGDLSAPVDQTQLEVVRSARPHDEPPSVAVYDDDPQTAWTPQTDAGETWIWLDLGLESPVREVRVLSRGRGSIDVAVSSDRRLWRDVDRIDIGGWQGLELREDARYVRLTLLSADDGGELPAIAEATVYGPDRRRSVSSEQRAGEARERNRDRQSRSNGKSAAEQKAADDASSGGNEERGEPRSGGRVRISAEPGETRCRGNGERCEARQGEVSVEEDCEREGTCTIDVRADGGTAVCEAAGGDETKAGNSNGRRGGKAGRCEADANGGAVAVGDVNP